MPFFGVPIRNGVPIGLGSVAGFGISPFDPSQLFSAGEQGAWYDPSDLSTMFNDAAGTQPITSFTTNQPVGLLLDKSKGLVLGPELVTNGDFSSGTTGWVAQASNNIAVVSGELEITLNSALFSGAAGTSYTLVPGKWYVATATARRGTSAANVTVRFGSGVGEGDLTFTTTSNVTKTRYFVATTTTTTPTVATSSSSGSGTIYADNISIRELPGNHATASGSARPVLSRRYNLLLATTTLATQNVTTVATSYTLRFTGAGSITLSGTATGTLNAGTHTVTATAGTLTLTVTGTVTDADLRRTIDANAFQPAYQRVVTATDYDGDGFLPYLEYSGAQAMATGSIDFTAGDKMSVWAGVTKLSDAADGILTELSINVAGAPGSFYVTAPEISSFLRYATFSRGSAAINANQNAGTSSAAYNSPITNVLTGTMNIAGDSNILRLNGTQVAQAAGDQGAGNYGNYPLYIGARAASSIFFRGRIFSLIVRGAQSSAAQISATESWVAQRTGISL